MKQRGGDLLVRFRLEINNAPIDLEIEQDELVEICAAIFAAWRQGGPDLDPIPTVQEMVGYIGPRPYHQHEMHQMLFDLRHTTITKEGDRSNYDHLWRRANQARKQLEADLGVEFKSRGQRPRVYSTRPQR